jgi:pyruvate dehydrogenase E2 component (dihydrolipoamide acetyltransferase)
MAAKVIMPQGGQDITEGVVVRWLKNEGQPVKKGEVICEVETEKAVFEVEAPEDGVLLKIVVTAGQKAPIFSVIGVVGKPGETVDLEEPGLPAEAKAEKTAAASEISKPAAEKPRPEKEWIFASGRARKLAAEKGVNLAKVKGTGPNGRITEKDVLAYLEKPAVEVAAPTFEYELPAKVKQAMAAAGRESRAKVQPSPAADLRGKTVPMTKMRKVIARRLQQSKQTIPHFYVTVSVDMSAAVRLREELNQKTGPDAKISMNDMLVKAAAMALEAFPEINCKIEEESIVYLEDINIGVAVSLEDGLVVPVLPDVGSLSLKGIAKRTKEIIALAKAGKQATLTAGTFTISNMGMLDVDNFIAIINPPETAILAVGSTRKQLVVQSDNSLRVCDLITMTLSADHRAVDGVLASRFINQIKANLQNPQTLLG